MKNHIFSLSAFTLGIIIGYFLLSDISSFTNGGLNHSETTNLKELLSFKVIFLNNLKVALLNIIGGISFGVLTVVNLLYNGFSFYILLQIIYVNDSSYFINLLPHSTEIIAFIMSGSIGINMGIKFYNLIFKNQRITVNLKSISIQLFIIVLIIFISALVEVYISPFI